VRVALDQAVQTASAVLERRLSAREAVTILATLTREAVPAARELRREDPDRADSYRELVIAVGRELRRHEGDSTEPRHLRAVTDYLARIVHALE
jgi:hypothetical protein